MKYIIDRIENNIAILESSKKAMIEVPLEKLPTSIKEGSVIVYDNNEYKLDIDEEELRRKKLWKSSTN